MSGHSLRVLIVEDEPDGQEVVALILSHFNIHTNAVGDAHEAIDALEADYYDCVLIDLQLPEVDGWELLAEIRQSEQYGAIPCIAITAYHTSSVRQEAINAGFDAYFAKPLDEITFVRELIGIVERSA